MREDILAVSNLLKNKAQLFSTDYKEILDNSKCGDLVYLDPPYQGTGLNGGFNYVGNIDFNEFVISLFELNYRSVPYILSFDGRTENKTYGNPLPEDLNLVKIEINAGRSSQATLLNRKEFTYEAVYLSPALVDIINLNEISSLQNSQLELY
jgi:DNA adenine methylase